MRLKFDGSLLWTTVWDACMDVPGTLSVSQSAGWLGFQAGIGLARSSLRGAAFRLWHRAHRDVIRRQVGVTQALTGNKTSALVQLLDPRATVGYFRAIQGACSGILEEFLGPLASCVKGVSDNDP